MYVAEKRKVLSTMAETASRTKRPKWLSPPDPCDAYYVSQDSGGAAKSWHSPAVVQAGENVATLARITNKIK